MIFTLASKIQTNKTITTRLREDIFTAKEKPTWYQVKGSTTSKPTPGKKILVIYSSIVICLPLVASVLLATSSSLCSHWHLMSNPSCCITQHGEELFGSNAEFTATARDGIATTVNIPSLASFRKVFF